MRAFVLKMLGIVLLLASVLVMEATVMGTLPLLLGLPLLALSGFACYATFRRSLRVYRRSQRARRAAARAIAPAAQPAARRTGAPALRVVVTGKNPDGPRVA